MASSPSVPCDAERRTASRAPLVHEPEGAERRQGDVREARVAVALAVVRVDATGVAAIGSAVYRGIGVEHLAPASRQWQAGPVTLARHGSEVRDDDDRRRAVA